MFAELGQPHWIVLTLAGVMALGPRRLAEWIEERRDRWLGAARDWRRRRTDLANSEEAVWIVVVSLILALTITIWAERLPLAP